MIKSLTYLLYSYLFLYLRSVVWSAAILFMLVLSLDEIYCVLEIEMDGEDFLDMLFNEIGFQRITHYLINTLTVIDLGALLILWTVRWTGSLSGVATFLEKVSRTFSNHLSMAVFYLVLTAIIIVISFTCHMSRDWFSFTFLWIMGVVASLMIFTLINAVDSFLWKHLAFLSRGKSRLESLF